MHLARASHAVFSITVFAFVSWWLYTNAIPWPQRMLWLGIAAFGVGLAIGYINVQRRKRFSPRLPHS